MQKSARERFNEAQEHLFKLGFVKACEERGYTHLSEDEDAVNEAIAAAEKLIQQDKELQAAIDNLARAAQSSLVES